MTEQTQSQETEKTAVQEEIQPTYEELQARITELEGMLKDEQLRGLANEQNLRRRFQDEIQAAHKFAAQKFATEMLTVKDYLEMALLDQSGNFDALKMGVSMTLNESEEQEPGSIISVLKKGYTMNDRVLRPAMVTVAKKI